MKKIMTVLSVMAAMFTASASATYTQDQSNSESDSNQWHSSWDSDMGHQEYDLEGFFENLWDFGRNHFNKKHANTNKWREIKDWKTDWTNEGWNSEGWTDGEVEEENDANDPEDNEWQGKHHFTRMGHHGYGKKWHGKKWQKRWNAWKKHKRHHHKKYPTDPVVVPVPASSVLFLSALAMMVSLGSKRGKSAK